MRREPADSIRAVEGHDGDNGFLPFTLTFALSIRSGHRSALLVMKCRVVLTEYRRVFVAGGSRRARPVCSGTCPPDAGQQSQPARPRYQIFRAADFFRLDPGEL